MTMNQSADDEHPLVLLRLGHSNCHRRPMSWPRGRSPTEPHPLRSSRIFSRPDPCVNDSNNNASSTRSSSWKSSRNSSRLRPVWRSCMSTPSKPCVRIQGTVHRRRVKPSKTKPQCYELDFLEDGEMLLDFCDWM